MKIQSYSISGLARDGNNMIKLSQTYEIVTEESAELGEAEDSGFDWQDVDYTFKELIDLIKREGFYYPSDSHGVPRWLSTDPVQNCSDGSYETKSIHPGRDKQSQKYWVKACKAAGIVK